MRVRVLPLFVLLLAGLATAAAEGQRAAKRSGGGFLLSTGERLSLSKSGTLRIRQGRAEASLPLPRDVAELVGVDEGPVPGAIGLKLGRACPPDRSLALTHEDLEARLLVARTRGRGQTMLAALRKAVVLAPNQADLRLKLLRGLLAAGQAQEAKRILSEGLRVTPFEVAWLAGQDKEVARLVTEASAARPPVDLGCRGAEPSPASAAWSSARRMAAFVDHAWNLRVVAAGNAEVFTGELGLGRELDESGRVLPAATKAVAARVAAAEAMLGLLGFRTLPTSQRISAERNDDLSWVRWKERGVVASAGNHVIRVRQGGKVVFEDKIDTTGTIGLDWGLPLPEEGLLLLAWSRIVGSDTCPNDSGISQVPLPGPR
ncbi:MAG: hypothetical protein JXP73_19165 [Deltaproteobacteria bacterium]|nr:hypothetical protein [Deltaproteobacteria bacterium]